MTNIRPDDCLLRSLLFVPAVSDKYLAKAHLRGADAIILDLEDSVAETLKTAARQRAGDAVNLLADRGVARIFVRINSTIIPAIRDLEAVVGEKLYGVVAPKCKSAEYLRLISSALAALEQERGISGGQIRLGVRVETAQGFFQMEEIAAADERISFFGLGGEDFSFSMGAEPTIDVLRYPKQRAIIAARAAGVSPIGLIGSGADFSDLDGFRANALLSRQFGFEGATCIHPALVPILNQAFTPSDDEIERAGRLVSAYSDAQASGSGSISFEGRMVDAPVAARARRVVALANAVRKAAG